MRYRCALQPRNDWAQRIVLVFRKNRRGIGIANDLELMWLHYSPQRVLEQTRIFRRPKVYVHCVQPVHVLALVRRVEHRKVPLRGVLVRACRGSSILTPKTIDSEREQAGVLVYMISPDCLQL
jgi:hypothetical protein